MAVRLAGHGAPGLRVVLQVGIGLGVILLRWGFPSGVSLPSVHCCGISPRCSRTLCVQDTVWAGLSEWALRDPSLAPKCGASEGDRAAFWTLSV